MPDSDSRPDLVGDARGEVERPGVARSGSSTLGESAGDVIDRYKLLEEVGEGGMGTVWMAEQSEPVKRRVALKIIKLGMDTREVVVRFEAERQALALMDHPHIAKVFDGGATDRGRPYFVMELVTGTPITDYCDAAQLGLRERLELFTKVCGAVQHAHQKGVIHRDLKPSNVLVTLHDTEPVPKVIDFGIAKATSAELTQKTMFTRHAQMLGTPEYMAPEQAERSGLDIDTRADVYALGALLYEMLTGSKLFDMSIALEAGFEELLRTIREVDPQKPSTRVSAMGEEASPIASNRHVNVDSLRKRLTGDLDWIVMKALEKDRARRYETANGFAADVQRYLDQEPVVAAPPSATYRFRKFVWRRKKTVAAIATIVVLVVAGSVGTGVGWWNTQKANTALTEALTDRNRALDEKAAALAEEERQRELAQENEQRALLAESEAEQRAEDLQRVSDFQEAELLRGDPFEMGARLRAALVDATNAERRDALEASLAGVDFTGLSREWVYQTFLVPALAVIDEEFAGQPRLQAQLLAATASRLGGLGLVDRTAALRRRVLEIEKEVGTEESVAAARLAFGASLDDASRLSEAEEVLIEAVHEFERLYGEEHPDSIGARRSLLLLLSGESKRFDLAEPMSLEVLETSRRVFGDVDHRTWRAMRIRGTVLKNTGRYDEAETLLQEARVLSVTLFGEDSEEAMGSVTDLASLRSKSGDFEGAEAFYREVLEYNRRKLGHSHPNSLHALGGIGHALYRKGDYNGALETHLEVLKRSRQGARGPYVMGALGSAAEALFALGRTREALEYLLEADGLWRELAGDDHRRRLDNTIWIVNLANELEEFAMAEPFARQAVEGARRFFDVTDSRRRNALRKLHEALQGQGKLAELEEIDRELLESYWECWRRSKSEHGHFDYRTVHWAGWLRRYLLALGDYAELAELAREQVSAARSADPVDRAFLDLSLTALGIALIQGNDAEAETVLLEIEELEPALGPSDDGWYHELRSHLALALASRGRHQEGEPIMLESAEWFVGSPDRAGDHRLAKIVLRAAEFHESWNEHDPEGGHDARAAEWRAKYEEYPGE